MSEAEDKQVIEKPRISRLAVWSLILAICFIFFYIGLRFEEISKYIPCFLFILLFLAGLVGCVMGIVSFFLILKSKGRLKGIYFAIAGIAISISVSFLFYYEVKLSFYMLICNMRLRNLGKFMEFYSNNHNGKYPTNTKWCDLLLLEMKTSKEDNTFKCPERPKGPCSYAMNPNCHPNSPPDMVLLFDSKGGWNQFGGAELLNPDNHGGRGCNVLFNDIGVRFVNKEDFGILKWRDEKVSTQKQGNKE